MPVITNVQPPLILLGAQALLQRLAGTAHPLTLIAPHPVLVASWIGLLITALNLIPAGQLDGGHILYALSPRAHRWSSRLVVVALLLLGVFQWIGWIIWGIILATPGMRHPRVPDATPLTSAQLALAPICLVLLLVCGTFHPFKGLALLNLVAEFSHHQTH